jgi:hypothetical protein
LVAVAGYAVGDVKSGTFTAAKVYNGFLGYQQYQLVK